MSFFSQYSNELTVALFFMGFVPGILVGYCFWRHYSERAYVVRREVEGLDGELAQLRADNHTLMTQLASAR